MDILQFVTPGVVEFLNCVHLIVPGQFIHPKIL